MARKKQGYNARLDESMGGRSGRKSQSEKSRRDESTGMERSSGRRKYSAAGTMDKSGRVKMQMGGLPEHIQPDMSGVDSRLAALGPEMEAMQQTDPRLQQAKAAYDFEQTPEGAAFKAQMEGYHNRPGAGPSMGGQGIRPTSPMPRGYRAGGMATMPSSNTTVRGPHGGKATSKNTNMHKLNAMGKLKGQ